MALIGEKSIKWVIRYAAEHFSEISVMLTENLFSFYSLESPTEEEEENLNEQLVITRSKSTFVGVKKLHFIYNEY